MAVRRVRQHSEPAAAAARPATRTATGTPVAAGNPGVSRRRFMRLLAAGTAAALAAPRMAVAAAEMKPPATTSASRAGDRMTRPRAGKPGGRPALPEEIEKQKKSMAESLAKIREFSLPPGSPPSFVFRPLKPRRAGRNG